MALAPVTAAIGLARKGRFLLNENSTTILTGVGVVGTVTTAYLTGRASFKAAALIEQEELIRDAAEENGEKPNIPQLTKFEKVRLVWRHFIPPFVSCVTTVTCIIVANKIASKKIAALALASGISERALQEYKTKVIEKIGERQDTKIRDEIAQERVNQNPVNSHEVIIAGSGEVLCYDMITGRYFQSTVEEIKRAENKINHTLNNFMAASASEFYDQLGLPSTTYTDTVGWNANEHVEVTFSTVMSTDQRPCIAIDFVKAPFPDYARHYD